MFMYIYIIGPVRKELYYLNSRVVRYFLAASQAYKIAFQNLIVICFHIYIAIFMPAFPAGLAKLNSIIIISIYPFQQSMKMKGIFGVCDEIPWKTERYSIVFEGFFN